MLTDSGDFYIFSHFGVGFQSVNFVSPAADSASSTTPPDLWTLDPL